ncbi:nucleotide disphospho-sugar-binding domain-containing protein [Amycolatopsis pithecellobii]|uniref:DUF1205 domain-containing protein n=1 Tax=Amycolatopsis pithecellobii TaxID=664692 RepID=A0A6N7Z384_9PSEU|nr:nucleotide disphospho-sugar-binding domain-containing protein [Amycolatopsis pithecellobii]MTD54540.1 DUF1205 domain-containing protein [Amycolatopsis pithecellobii]
MRVLFLAGPSPATIFALSPLATAIRNAGHEVFMATTEEMASGVADAGFPAVAVTAVTLHRLITTDRAGETVPMPEGLAQEWRHSGGWWGRLAAAGLGGLLELAADWRPDLVVGGTLCYAAPLLAAHLGVPYVRHAWDGVDPRPVDAHAEHELRPELAQFGLDQLPEPDLFVETWPASVRGPVSAHTQPMRWVPGNRQRRLERWMYTRGDSRRVCVTAGNRVSLTQSQNFLRTLVRDIAELGVEVVVAAPEDAAAEIGGDLPGVHVGWLPLDVVAPTCDVVVHHGGGVTSMTAFNAGVPQLCLPQWAITFDSVREVAGSGAGLTLLPHEATHDAVTKACGELLTDPAYGERARDVAREIARMPAPADVVGVLERLVAA